MDKELLEDLESLSKENRKLKTELEIYKLAMKISCVDKIYMQFALKQARKEVLGDKYV